LLVRVELRRIERWVFWTMIFLQNVNLVTGQKKNRRRGGTLRGDDGTPPLFRLAEGLVGGSGKDLGSPAVASTCLAFLPRPFAGAFAFLAPPTGGGIPSTSILVSATAVLEDGSAGSAAAAAALPFFVRLALLFAEAGAGG
jgi:hypothetical protein